MRLVQERWRKIKKGPQRMMLCRLVIDILRMAHGTYAPSALERV
jgi:hypothetical protein